MNERPPDDPGDSGVTEIVLKSDGRVYVFGMSRQVLEVLGTLNSHDLRLRSLLDHATIHPSEEAPQGKTTSQAQAPSAPPMTEND